MAADLSFSFYRRYHSYTGGHQKVRDYLGHTLAFNQSKVSLFLERGSSTVPDLFDHITGVNYVDEYRPNLQKVVFLAGMDWQAYLPRFDPHRPKINLIQHVRHGDPAQPLHAFLEHKAIRLCVSEAVRQAILPYANGPCLTIKMGHDVPQLKSEKVQDVYILANKQPEMGQEIAAALKLAGINVLMHDTYVDKHLVLSAMASSRVSLLLPNKTEGFYLPGIEAMQLSDWAVVPDCVANREYCLPGTNISMCEHSVEACLASTKDALMRSDSWLSRVYRYRGQRVVNQYRLNDERRNYHAVLSDLEQLWSA